MFTTGVLPGALYGAEYDPWSEGEILALEKQAVRALQLRSPGVPHVIACLTLPAVADPRFRIHYAAVERWARELWATAYGYDAQVLGHRRVSKDILTHREIMGVWHKIHNSQAEDLIKEGGPIGAMAQAALFFDLTWQAAASWGHPTIGEIELTEGPPAMVKHLLEQDRLRTNTTEYARRVEERARVNPYYSRKQGRPDPGTGNWRQCRLGPIGRHGSKARDET